MAFVTCAGNPWVPVVRCPVRGDGGDVTWPKYRSNWPEMTPGACFGERVDQLDWVQKTRPGDNPGITANRVAPGWALCRLGS